jgi:hypothetical protein
VCRYSHPGLQCTRPLRAVARALMRNHLTHCAAKAIRAGSDEKRQAVHDKLLLVLLSSETLCALA